MGWRMLDGCSAQPEGVDDDRLGVFLNYACSLVLLGLGLVLARKHRAVCRPEVITEVCMSLGYVLGGAVHGLFANRANDDQCSNVWFYPVFALSYGSMIGSAAAWLSMAPQGYTRQVLNAALLVSALLITSGASWCQATLDLYHGSTDDW